MYICSMGSSVVCMCGGVRDRYSTLLIMNRAMLVIEDVHMLSPHSKHWQDRPEKLDPSIGGYLP